MMSKIILALVFMCVNLIGEVPQFWSSTYLFGKSAPKAWRALSVDGQLSFGKVYNLGGEGYSSDGDKEFKDALMIFCVDQDPREYLQEGLNAKDIKRLTYTLLLIGHLKDQRFKESIKRLEGDSRTVKDCFFGTTIGAVATHSLSMIDRVSSDLRSEKLKKFAATWLKESWSLYPKKKSKPKVDLPNSKCECKNSP